MLVNHLAKRHPDISLDSVPELNLPILKATKEFYCQYCDKVYKSSSKRKLHILKNHPGAALPMSNRKQGLKEVSELPNLSFSQTVGSVTTSPQNCKWCHKQYASKAKLLHHQRKEHLSHLKVKKSCYDSKEEEKDDTISDMNVDRPVEIRENTDMEFQIYKQASFVVRKTESYIYLLDKFDNFLYTFEISRLCFGFSINNFNIVPVLLSQIGTIKNLTIVLIHA